MIELAKLSEQLKNQQTDKIKNWISKHTHDVQSADTFRPKTKRLLEVNESTKKQEAVFENLDSENENQQQLVPAETNSDKSEDENDYIEAFTWALPNSANFSKPMKRTLGYLMKRRNSWKRSQDYLGWASFFSVPIQKLGGDEIEIGDIVYELTDKL